MSLTLYTNPMSRGRIARWMCEEIRAGAGIDYETVILDYDGAMKADDYLAVNPMGKVPAIDHDGRIVTEAAAICAYLADAVPKANLAPAPDDRADYYRWLFFAAGPLEQAVVNRALGVTQDADQSRTVGYGTYERTVDVLDGWLGRHDYVCGGRFTAADVYVGAAVGWGLAFKTLPERPAFRAYDARLSDRPAFREAVRIDDALLAEAGG